MPFEAYLMAILHFISSAAVTASTASRIWVKVKALDLLKSSHASHLSMFSEKDLS
jgi:hypothetical protein